MTYSEADMRAQVAPPDECQRCQRVIFTISPTGIRRWTCNRHLHMQPACTQFAPLPGGRRVEPALTFQGHHRHD